MNLGLSQILWRFATILTCFWLTACATTSDVQPGESSQPRYTLALFPWHVSPHRSGESQSYGRFALAGALKKADFLPV